MRKILIALIIMLGLGGLFYWLNRTEIPQVRVATLETGLVESLVANTRAGTVRSCRRSKLSLPLGGTVATLHVKNGDRVQQGQLLLELWNNDQKARLEQAQAHLRATRLNVEEICHRAAHDKRELDRAETLARKKVISSEALDSARTKADISTHTCERAGVETKVAETQVSLQQALLDQTQLKAPFSGVVAEINGEVGEFVTPSPPGIVTPPAVDLIADDCLYVRAPIDEVDAAAIQVGMPARITLDAFRGQFFTGVVTRIAPYVQDYEKQARTVDIEAHFKPMPTEVTLLVGYSADIEVILQHNDSTLRVPTEAVIELNKVMLVGTDNVLSLREFEPGLANWTWTEAKSGLTAGDRVLLSLDATGAEAGARVQVAP